MKLFIYLTKIIFWSSVQYLWYYLPLLNGLWILLHHVARYRNKCIAKIIISTTRILRKFDISKLLWSYKADCQEWVKRVYNLSPFNVFPQMFNSVERKAPLRGSTNLLYAHNLWNSINLYKGWGISVSTMMASTACLQFHLVVIFRLLFYICLRSGWLLT